MCFILPAFLQAFFKYSDGWRKNENADCMWKLLSDLLRTLPVNFEQNVGSGCHLIGNLNARSAVVIAEYFCPFKKLSGVAACQEILCISKEILLTMLFAGTRCARGVGNRQFDGRFLLQKCMDQTGLACAGWSHDQKQAA